MLTGFFSGFGFHSCIANWIRIRIPASWIRTGIGLEKNLSPNTSDCEFCWFWIGTRLQN